jgi:hypothetical protein
MRPRLSVANLVAQLGGKRGPHVFVMVHPENCEPCARYRVRLQAVLPSLHEWSAHLVFESVAVGESPSLIVTDEWGEIFYQVVAAHDDLPDPAELVEWARFVAIQCEECEQPEGEWRAQ